MKSIIFLDFDGVLNSLRSTLAFGGCSRKQFDPVAVDLVARLAGEADAHVVISSAWRIGQTVEELQSILRYYSTTLPARVIDKTPSAGECRGAQIARWLADNAGRHNGRFVIVDDDADMLDSQLPVFVQTLHRDGFGVKEYVRCLQILAPEHKDATQLSWYAEDRTPSSQRRPLQWEAA